MSSTPGTEAAALPAQAVSATPAQATTHATTQAHVPVQSLGTATGTAPSTTPSTTGATTAAPRPGSSRMPFAFERAFGTAHGNALPALANERISFTARCPACGEDADWLEVREDTRVRNSVRCACAPDIAL